MLNGLEHLELEKSHLAGLDHHDSINPYTL